MTKLAHNFSKTTIPACMKPVYLTTLTPLRGIAALLMVVFHFNLMVMPVINPAITQLHRRWYLLVDFFFVLSGFIMVYVYGSGFAERVSGASFGRYMAARFARVYPLHLLTLLWLVAVYGWLVGLNGVKLDTVTQSVFDPAAILLHVFMLHGFNTAWTATWNTPAWSIGSEWLMYLLFPFLMPVFRRIPMVGKWVLVALVACLYAYLTRPLATGPLFKPWLLHISWMIDNIMFPESFFRCLAGFLLGMITHELYQQQWAKSQLKSGIVFGGLGVGLAVAYHFLLPDLLTIWVFPLLILGAAYTTGRVATLLKTKPFQRLGDWSYSIYMVHIPIMFTFLAVQLTKPPAPKTGPTAVVYGPQGPITCLIYVVLVLAVSALTYRFVEVPARRWLNARLLAKANRQSVAVS
ncbi:acyltransferase [Spirosoma arcticum]